VDVVELLARERPSFQLQSGTAELHSTEELFRSGATVTEGLARANFGIGRAEAEYLASVVRPDMATLETGGGASTVVFASRARRHVCVNPDATANRLIREFMETHGLRTDGLEFVEESSDQALPNLDPGPLDVAFIDGSHSFPLPIIDWHYIDPHLKVGGLLLVDDAGLNAVRMLCDFLDLDACHERIAGVGDCAVWRKTGERLMGWGDQEINRHPFVGYRPITASYVIGSAKRTVKRLLHR
jgi:hypothetical protein